MRTLFKQGFLVASAAALVVACGGGDKNQQAKAPSTDQTMTTGANPQMGAQDQQMQQPQGYTFDQSQQGGMGGAGQTGQTGTMGTDQSGMGGSAPVDQGMGTSGSMGQGTQGGMMGQGDTSSAEQGTSGTAGGSTKAKTTERALNDAEIFAVETAANEGEIQMAEIARKSARSGQVKNFANMMVTDHRAAQNKAKDIAKKAKITASDNEVSNQLKSDVQSMVTELKGEKGAAFDKMYMDDQVKAHRNVLDVIDNRLLPNVSDSDMKTHLSDVRSKVADHLSKAEDIQTKLGQQPAASAGAKSETGKAKSDTTTEKKSTTEKTKQKGTTEEKDKNKSHDSSHDHDSSGAGDKY